MTSFICMVGADYQRIIDGIKYWGKKKPIERIYLLCDKKKKGLGGIFGSISHKNARDLEKEFSFYKPVRVVYDPVDYADVFCILYKIINEVTKRGGKEIFIDATSSPKEAYGAALTLASMFESIKVYIVPTPERGWYLREFKNEEEFNKWFYKQRSRPGTTPQEIYLPASRIGRPSKEEEIVLQALAKHNDYAQSIKTLIRWCAMKPSSKTRNECSRIVSRLEEKGFVRTSRYGRAKTIELTEFGKLYAEALRYTE